MERGTSHFIGIGGIGMSAIARILLLRGESVTGSDLVDSPLVTELRAAGAHITIGHDPRNVNGAREVIVSSAIDARNLERLRALERGIPVVRRGEMLARLMRERKGIGVCGTHGKTTTTAMTAAIMQSGGIDPTVLLGGIACETGTNARAGSSPWFLTEADESDGSFALLDPLVAVVTNIENDHLKSDADLPQLVRAFERFLGKLPANGTAVIGIDSPLCKTLAAKRRSAATVSVGLDPSADLCAFNMEQAHERCSFDVIAGGVCLGSVQLRVPGRMNVQNALAALAVGRALEIPFAAIAGALQQFSGVRRRFEILIETARMTVVDDYAHHPTAVRGTIATARAYRSGPLIVAFQPHRFTRTAYLAADFAAALAEADAVYLTPIYAAGESPVSGVTERTIGKPLSLSGAQVRYVSDVRDLRPVILREAPRGSTVLMLGAGDITTVAAALAQDVRIVAA